MESSDAEEWVEMDPTGRYVRYKEVLGKGAFKTVYKGFDEVEGTEVAWNRVKIDHVLRSPQDLERLYSEIHLLKSLKHENLMKFYNSWVDGEKKTINIITELFTSGNLRQYRSKHKNIDTKGIKRWARQILQGLEYLHSQKPPIAHRDLKCDNIFVNGNRGEVKIGDLGLAAVMHQPTAHSVVGTPEFMAPELYDEEYTELVDIYSFGLCLLEMVTFDYPYSECKTPAQIYKKVINGVKPLSLSKVQDPMVKQFIEKCLVPAAHRPSARELLEDPFLCGCTKDDIRNLVQPLDNAPIAGEVVKSEPQSMEIDADYKQFPVNSSTKADSRTSEPSSILEISRTNRSYEFTLMGEKCKDNAVELTLRIGEPSGRAKYIHFLFYLDSDTALTVAGEMVEQLDLSHQDVNFIAELIDFLIMKLVPHWEHPVIHSSSQPKSQCILPQAPLGDSFSNRFELDPPNGVFSLETSEADASYLTSESVDINCFISGVEANLGESLYGHVSEIDLGGVDIPGEKMDKNDSSINENLGPNALSSGEAESDISDLCLSLPTDIDDKVQDDDLSLELAAIESNYTHMVQELSRMREFALEDARKRWLMKKNLAVV